MENTRDKLALCMELNEASTAKEHLSNALSSEIKKINTIEESKKQCENEAIARVKLKRTNKHLVQKISVKSDGTNAKIRTIRFKETPRRLQKSRATTRSTPAKTAGMVRKTLRFTGELRNASEDFNGNGRQVCRARAHLKRITAITARETVFVEQISSGSGKISYELRALHRKD